MTVGAVLESARTTLPGSTPDLDAELLLAEAVGRSREWVLANRNATLDHPTLDRWKVLAARRSAHESIAYILGRKEFYGRDFAVGPAVLVPRPESELLVEAAVECAAEGDTILDVGTGSGCLAVTIALARPDLKVIASDISPEALAVAKANAERHGANIRFVQADLVPEEDLDWARTVVVANLPYGRDAEVAAAADLSAEPTLAINGGHDGLDVIRRLFEQCADRKIIPKKLILEIDPRQAKPLAALSPRPVTFKADLAGLTRIAII